MTRVVNEDVLDAEERLLLAMDIERYGDQPAESFTTLDDFWPEPDAPDPVPTPRKCKHPRSKRRALETGGVACTLCGADIDPTRARRGRTSRNRGNAYEREVAAKLGGRRVGQYGDSVDVDVPGYLRVQCKNGGAYPERIDRWLRAIPVEAGELRAVVIGDAPGPGTHRRSLIVFDLDDYAMWHGRK